MWSFGSPGNVGVCYVNGIDKSMHFNDEKSGNFGCTDYIAVNL